MIDQTTTGRPYPGCGCPPQMGRWTRTWLAIEPALLPLMLAGVAVALAMSTTVDATRARVRGHWLTLTVLGWLARRTLWQVAAHLPVIRGALAKWEAVAVAVGAALVLEPSPLGEIVLTVMACWLLVRRYQLMRVLWAAGRIEARAWSR